MPNYGDSAYWEQRYVQERMEHGHRYTYDWYFPWSTMETYVANFCSEEQSERVLIAGCGNSLWPEEMYESGYHNITCVDWSREVIGTMSTRNRAKQGMVYEHADVRRLLQFGDSSLDLVIDKACLDAVMCGFDGIKNADLYMQEVHRVLRPGGYFFLLTFGNIEMRMPTLTKALGWKVEHALVPRNLQHHIFMCEREPNAPAPAVRALPAPQGPGPGPEPGAAVPAADGEGAGANAGAAEAAAVGGATPSKIKE